MFQRFATLSLVTLCLNVGGIWSVLGEEPADGQIPCGAVVLDVDRIQKEAEGAGWSSSSRFSLHG